MGAPTNGELSSVEIPTQAYPIIGICVLGILLSPVCILIGMRQRNANRPASDFWRPELEGQYQSADLLMCPNLGWLVNQLPIKTGRNRTIAQLHVKRASINPNIVEIGTSTYEFNYYPQRPIPDYRFGHYVTGTFSQLETSTRAANTARVATYTSYFNVRYPDWITIQLPGEPEIKCIPTPRRSRRKFQIIQAEQVVGEAWTQGWMGTMILDGVALVLPQRFPQEIRVLILTLLYQRLVLELRRNNGDCSTGL